tara:strand:+ start:1148 stop:1333 length:186 start_codon:yes stop_codon:yes gene_type:complete
MTPNVKFEITTIKLEENDFGKNDLLISKVKVMDDNGKYIKFARINEALLKRNEGIRVYYYK